MTWHYQIRKRTVNGEMLYDIVEAYGKPFGWTIDSIVPVSETRKGLILTLQMMLNDATKYRTLTEKED